jgi:WD40 repeat protein
MRRERDRFEGRGDWVTSIALSPDRARLATGSDEGTARLWDMSQIPKHDAFRTACERLPRRNGVRDTDLAANLADQAIATDAPIPWWISPGATEP